MTSVLALGTVNLGTERDEVDSMGLLDAATDAGIMLVDTADIYGRRPGVGYTELLIGKWLSTRPVRRSSVQIATKIGMPFTAAPGDRGLGGTRLRRACDAALARLGIDRIELLLFHEPDPDTPVEETWTAVAELQQAGKVRHVGTSNHPPEGLVANHAAAISANAAPPVAEQSAYNLLNRRVENDLLATCKQLDMGFMAWSPLARGLLGGMLARRRVGDTAGRLAIPAVVAALDEHATRVHRYETLCDESGYDPAALALAWLVGQPAVSTVVIGPRTERQLEAALDAADTVVDSAVSAELDRIFPPGTPRSGWPHP